MSVDIYILKVMLYRNHKLQAKLGSGSVAPRWALAVKEWKDPD